MAVAAVAATSASLAAEAAKLVKVEYEVLPHVLDMHAAMAEDALTARWVGKPIGALQLPGSARVAALGRLGEGRVPDDDLLVQEGDLLWFTVPSERLGDLDAHLAGEEVGR